MGMTHDDDDARAALDSLGRELGEERAKSLIREARRMTEAGLNTITAGRPGEMCPV